MTRRDNIINSILRLTIKIRPLYRFLSKFKWYTNLMNRQARKIIDNLCIEEKKDTNNNQYMATVIVILGLLFLPILALLIRFS